ncbi:unnamed protein product [Hymenolepis diminuta]|uniref:Leucine-rich repeat-containing protein 34 n=1 Tax=Hymenolepis diminuta TaxID=6216 RepID=A0A0R3SFI8_HYMDI|nr:unnamed protein product [Hymenolepis diminuta]
MSDERLRDLESLIKTYKDVRRENLSEKSSIFILNMMNKELELNKLEWIYLKLCGNKGQEIGYRLADNDIPHLCATLLTDPVINSLDLRYNRISDDGASILANFLKEDLCLKELNLKGNFISDKGASEIGEALKCNHTLEKLDISVNPISREGGIALADGLLHNNTLTHLDVANCDLEISAAIAFATALRSNKSILYFNIDRLTIFSNQEEHTVHLSEALSVNTEMRELHMSKCFIHDFGTNRIADALDRNKILQVLDLSANGISTDGGAAIARALSNRCSLTILDLAYNQIKCQGAVAIAKALEQANQRLIVLNLSFNKIGERGLCALGESLYTNDSIRFIYLWGNNITDKAAEIWANLILTERLREDSIDLKPYKVDGKIQVALQVPKKEQKGYRYPIPSWCGQPNEERSLAIF